MIRTPTGLPQSRLQPDGLNAQKDFTADSADARALLEPSRALRAVTAVTRDRQRRSHTQEQEEKGQDAVAVASIHLPLAAPRAAENSSCKLQLIVFRNGKLFPCTGDSSKLADDGKRRSVATPVAFIKLDGCSARSAVQPVTIALRHWVLGADPTAAYWDFDLLDGHGGWRAEGCHITATAGNTTTIHCTHHNNFAVLMSTLCYNILVTIITKHFGCKVIVMPVSEVML
ncbi:hypothetical protein NFI96_010402 [Prochilodus magdalenae]|nr:hypothetical protein NFI96_010402 [Prochilodus magdalenae]